MMAVGLAGGGEVAKEEVVETDDESALGSEAECEAFAALESGTDECLLPYQDSRGLRGQTLRVGDETLPCSIAFCMFYCILPRGPSPSPQVITETTSTAPMTTPTRHCYGRRQVRLA